MSQSGVLQRLMAERYNAQPQDDKADDNTKNLQESYPNTKQRLLKSKSEDHADIISKSEQHRPQNKKSLLDTFSQRPMTLLPRLRQEFLTKQQQAALGNNAVISSQSDQHFQPIGSRGINNEESMHGTENLQHLSSLTEPKLTLYGHPKSNSSGDEFLYTDRQSKVTRSAVARRRNNSRGKTAAVVRSRSMHAATTVSRPERYQQSMQQMDLSSRLRPASAAGAEISVQRNISDCSSISSGSVRLENQSSLSRSGSSANEDQQYQISSIGNNQGSGQPQQRSFSAHSTDASNKRITSANSFISDTQQQRQTDPATTPMEMSVGTQHAVLQSAPRHGPYYAQIPTQPIGHVLNTPSSSRGPPPPYPTGSNSNVQNSMDGPQRPNSLALDGQGSRKRGNSGPSAPALTSPIRNTNFVNPFTMTEGTPIRGTPFYSFPQQDNSAASNTKVQNNNFKGQHQYQQHQMAMLHNQEHYNAGRPNVHNPPPTFTTNNNPGVSSQSSSSSSTAVGTPVSYPPHTTLGYPSERDSGSQITTPSNASPAYAQNYGTGNFVQQMQHGSNNGYSVGKSDSITSSTSNSSSGSRTARRAKRNSKNFGSNMSGSSSGTGGSRPNSSADLMECLISENESLRAQLTTFEKKFTNVTEDLQCLNKSVQKRDQLDKEMRSNMESENRRLKNENESLGDRVRTLSELVATLQSNHQTQGMQSSDIANEIMLYKEKYQRLTRDHSDLENDFTEQKDELSELKADYDLLLHSLKKKQDTIAQLKKSNCDRESSELLQLRPLLQMLRKTICDRQRVEEELTDTLRYNIQQQRNSTSSNDEGIGEGSNPPYDSLATNTVLQKNEKILRTKSGMLKLQQMYLNKQVADSSQEYVDATSDEVAQLEAVDAGYNAIGAMLHRHTISDPSFNKYSSTIARSSLRGLMENEFERNYEPSNNYNDVTNYHSPRRRRKHSPNVKPSLPRHNVVEEQKLSKNHQRDNKSSTSDDFNVNYSNCKNNISNEFDSPSEGYHSQQSSGSPTPSSERSSMHFAENDPRITNVVDGKNNQQKPVFIRRKSSDILTKLAANV